MLLETALLTSLYFKCGNGVHPETLNAIIQTESARNPYIIANVTDNTSHAFDSKEEAIFYANKLKSEGKKYSSGLMQIYSLNFDTYGLNNENVFDYCTNIDAGSKILKECFNRSLDTANFNSVEHLERAFSCYYSGNFKRGFSESDNYVERVKKNYSSIFEIPNISDYANKKKFGKSSLVDSNGLQAKNTFNQEKVLDENSWDIFNDFSKGKEDEKSN